MHHQKQLLQMEVQIFFIFFLVFSSSEPPGLQALHKALWSIDYYDVVCDVYITLEVQLVKNFV